MAIKDQKNIKAYVNLTKSMLYERTEAEEEEISGGDEAQTRKDVHKQKKLRKRTADNILRYLNSSESHSEKSIKKVIQIADDSTKFNEFQEEMLKILKLADIRVSNFGKKVLNTAKMSLGRDIPSLEDEIEDMVPLGEEKDVFARAVSGDQSAIDYLTDNPAEVENFLSDNPQYARMMRKIFKKADTTSRVDSSKLEAKDAFEISQVAKKMKALHLNNLQHLSNKIKSARIDPLKVFSFPQNADIFAELRSIYTILTIFEDFDRVGKNLEGEADEQSEYLKIITPQRMAELYKTSRKEFNKIITTFIRGSFARAAEMGARIAQAKKQPETFSMAATGKLEEIISSYQSDLFELEQQEDWYDKIRDKTHEYRITFDDWAMCFDIGKRKKLEIFGFLLSSPPKKVENMLDKMERQMSKTKGRCRPDPEAQIPFMENKSIIKEELTIHNETESDLSEFVQAASEFYPYSKQNLGFDKPVSLRLVSDLDNSQNTFGKTAHYDPNSMEIVIYTDNRHPKDMLRSLSHELVHHAQNCRGDFDGDYETGEGYAQNDPYMREKEAEAYLIGNGFMVRDYEDSLKEKNKMLSEEKIREMVRAGLKKALFEQEEVKEIIGYEEEEVEIGVAPPEEESVEEACADESSEDVMYETEELKEETVEETQEVTVESRLQNNNNFLFEKLTKMWTK